MSKRKWYHGNEINAYLMPLDKKSILAMPIVKFHTIDTDKWKYTFRFIHDTNVNVPLKERMKHAEEKCKVCFIFDLKYDDGCGENGWIGTITAKNLVNGEQVNVSYDELKCDDNSLLKKVLTII